MRDSARQLLDDIEDGFARFELEFAPRRAILAQRHQMFRLAEEYRRMRKEHPPTHQAPPPDDRAWGDEYLEYDGLTLISNNWNCDICLRHHPQLSGIIAIDLNTSTTMLKAPLPLDFWEFTGFEMRPFTQGDVTSVLQFCQGLGMVSIDRGDVTGAIQRIARENAWRPD